MVGIFIGNRLNARFLIIRNGIWLNMIESFFSKMTKQMLKGIRVNSKEELSERIYRYFDEINAEPIVYDAESNQYEMQYEAAVNSFHLKVHQKTVLHSDVYDILVHRMVNSVYRNIFGEYVL